VDIGGIVSFGDGNVDYVLMKIEDTSSGDDYYLTYNNATGINQGTQEGANQVIINTQAREGLERDYSYLVGLLDVGDSKTYTGFEETGEVTVEVISVVNGVASVQVSTTGDENCVPTSGPTSAPTTPIFAPSPLPTAPEDEEPQIGGDPHIVTWRNEHYEFHGQCDLVILKDPNFANGLGLDVHIRTKLVRFWSFIKNVAIRIGNDVLEIQGSSSSQNHHWINYEYQGELDRISGFEISYQASSASKSVYEIDLDSAYPNAKIIIKIYKEFVRVKLHHGFNKEAFGNTVGLLGDYESGKTYARDEFTVLDDFEQLGNEWQVLPGSDPKLFHELEKPQYPEKCLKPENPQGRRRRLSESNISIQDAEAACSSQLMDPLAIQDCIYDVMATQDLDMVGAF